MGKGLGAQDGHMQDDYEEEVIVRGLPGGSDFELSSQGRVGVGWVMGGVSGQNKQQIPVLGCERQVGILKVQSGWSWG